MPIKNADDKSKRLALLVDLQQSPQLTSSQKNWLRDEHSRVSKGIHGEQEAAFYLDSYFKTGTNHVVMHDLRFVVDDQVAQIDHLVISRASGIFLFETKNYSGNLVINEMGEFTAVYGHEQYGIPSPIEQSRRHERVLSELLKTLGITPRLGGMEFHHIVLLHPKAIITRPSNKVFDTSTVMKADQFPSWHKSYVDKDVGAFGVLKMLGNVRSVETIHEWGEKLLKQHRPADPLALPDFMKPQPQSSPNRPPHPLATAVSQPPLQATEKNGIAKKLICAHCGQKITYAEGKFCWNNEKRFGGLQYCRDHQGQC
jgi:hypothetical protein